MQQWKEQASQLQTSYYRTYHDKIWWSGIPDSTNLNQLQHTIGQVIYGHPTSEGREDLKKSGYKRKEIYRIKHIARRIMKNFKEETSMSVILICAKLKIASNTEHVFRVWDNSKEYFIDSAGRVYKNWDAFLKENLYPSCLLCYPAFGLYKINVREEVLVDYAKTPASGPKIRHLVKLDIITAIVALIGMILLIVSIVTNLTVMYIIAAVVILIGLPYRVYRAIKQFRDVWKHL